MKVVRLHAIGEFRLHEEPPPIPDSDEALVQVKMVGVCGSDLLWYQTAGIGDARLDRPLVLGHEFMGITEMGKRVVVDPAVPCGQCLPCREGNPNLCTALRFAGHGLEDGALREFVAWPTRCLIPLPDALSSDEAAMLEPLGVALHAVDLGKLHVGMRVGVFGCGPIGLLVLQLARLAGAAEVFATEPLAHRLEAAHTFGARDWKPGQEVDVGFECAGEDDAVATTLQAVKPGGRVVLVGIPKDDRTTISASIARRKGLTIKLSRRMKFTYPRAIALVEHKLVDVRSLVTHHFPLEQTTEAFALAAKRVGLKVMIEP